MKQILFILLFFIGQGMALAQPRPMVENQPAGSLQEKLLLHTAKDFYISGEVMWFKLYVQNAATGKLQDINKTAYAEILTADGVPVLQGRVELTGGTGAGSFQIPDEMRSGAYQFVAYTKLMQSQPGSFLRKSLTIINTQRTFDTTAFTITGNQISDVSEILSTEERQKTEPRLVELRLFTDKEVYGKRSPVSVNLSVQDAKLKDAASLSVSVIKLNQLTRPGTGRSQLAMDTAAIYDNLKIIPEINGYILPVAVSDPVTGKPVRGVPVTLSLTGKLADMKIGESDENGLVYFNIKNVYGPSRFYVTVGPAFHGKADARVLSSFARFKEKGRPQRGAISDGDLLQVEEMHNELMIRRAYDSVGLTQFLPETPDSLSFYGKADATYLLDDYKRFITMEEVLREYVQQVMVRIRNKNFYIPVVNKQLMELRRIINVNVMMDKTGPLVLMDGIPISVNELIKYDPLKVRKLEVVAERYVIEKEVFEGILSFTTYDGKYDDIQLSQHEWVYDVDGWQRQRIFRTPDYSQPAARNSPIPDFRHVLYWNPQLKGDEKFSFFTADNTGEFLIEVKGVTKDGSTISAKQTITVE